MSFVNICRDRMELSRLGHCMSSISTRIRMISRFNYSLSSGSSKWRPDRYLYSQC